MRLSYGKTYQVSYYKFIIIRENFIFANIHEFDYSRIQHSREIFRIQRSH